jgi:hypothetical protein
VRTAIALRAGYVCSFEGCEQLTVGPSDESEMAHSSVGVAAHISAASPGGRRYDANMPSEERTSVKNAIWLCANHATLIDRDEATYTVARLQSMKLEHEARIAARLSMSGSTVRGGDDLIALGPNVIVLGSVVGASGSSWRISIRHFVAGDFGMLRGFCESFAASAQADRHLLVNEFGDGRVLGAAPVWTRTDDVLSVVCEVLPPFPRTRAQDLPQGLKLDPDHDLALTDGGRATVSGIEALAQKVSQVLSTQKGEWFLNRSFGTRLVEYFAVFADSPWLDRMAKLEVIRMAAIPYDDRPMGAEHTPLFCVERVHSFRVPEPDRASDWLRVELDLDVSGLGRWKRDLEIFVPRRSPAP